MGVTAPLSLIFFGALAGQVFTFGYELGFCKVGWRLDHRLSGRRPHDLGSAVPAGVVVGDFLAEGFQFGDEGVEAALVVEPGLVVGELVVGQDPGDGFAGDFAGPAGGRGRAAGAGRRGSGSSTYSARVIRSVRVPGRMKPGLGKLGDLRGEAGGAGLLNRGGRHAVIFAAGVRCLAHSLQYKCCMDSAGVAGYMAAVAAVISVPAGRGVRPDRGDPGGTGGAG